jgi:hypothetical protein
LARCEGTNPGQPRLPVRPSLRFGDRRLTGTCPELGGHRVVRARTIGS